MAIEGTSSSETLNGTAGNDDFYGYEGNDVLNGGSGDDDFFISGGSFGTDTYNGGDGSDWIKLYGNVVVSQFILNASNLSSIEGLDLGLYTVSGTTGGDTFDISGILSISSNDEFNMSDGNDSFLGHSGVDTVIGGSGNDTLNGGAGNDRLTGSEGNDTLIGGTGDDRFMIAGSSIGIDSYNGGDGTDKIELYGNVTVSQFMLGSSKVSSVEWLDLGLYTVSGTTGDDTFSISAIGGISSNDEFNLSDGNDSFVGHSGVDMVIGGSGNDTLSGGAGNDKLTGSEGNDTLIGGTGDDDFFISGSSFGTDTFTGGDGSDEIKLTGNVTVSQFMLGSSKVSSIEWLDLGLYTVSGTTGDDTFSISAIGGISSNDTFSMGDGNDSFTGHSGTDYVVGGSGNDTLNGGAGNDELTGDEGSDKLNGGSGADEMTGGAGSDTYYVDNAGDEVTEANVSGADLVNSSVSFSLAGQYIENLTLTGSGNITGAGNSLRNSLTGNSANNALNGGSGTDTMTGGAGNDTYYVDNAGDKVVEANVSGTDRVSSSVTFSLSGQYVENLSLTGSANINGTGNGLNNSLTGNAGKNTFNGGSGNDVLIGGAGNDTLAGGSGNDSFQFNAVLNATSNVDKIIDYNVADDTIRLENAIFTALTSTGTLASSAFRSNSTGLAADSNDRIIYETDTGKLFYDSNGSASGGSVHFATLTAGLSLTSADFLVV